MSLFLDGYCFFTLLNWWCFCMCICVLCDCPSKPYRSRHLSRRLAWLKKLNLNPKSPKRRSLRTNQQVDFRNPRIFLNALLLGSNLCYPWLQTANKVIIYEKKAWMNGSQQSITFVTFVTSITYTLNFFKVHAFCSFTVHSNFWMRNFMFK